jgi:hypothetical protein
MALAGFEPVNLDIRGQHANHLTTKAANFTLVHVLFKWEQYMKCDGLPDPASLNEMNTYIYLWRGVEERGLLEDVVKRTAEVLKVS